MRYRLLRERDVDTVYRLGKPDFGSQTEFSWDWSRESIREYLKHSHGFGIICVEGERIIGFVLIQKDYSSQKPNVSWVTYVYVIPQLRRHDIGSMLLERAVARLRKMGKRDLIADIYADNRGSIRFFTARKFKVQERWLLLRRSI